MSDVRTWFTADLHLGHRNIIGYCNRPFADAADMNRALIANWNETVGDGDTVWILGDFALGTIDQTLPMASELNGHKILVAGNHDRCWHGHKRRADGWTERYLDAGFDEIIQGQATVALPGGTTATVCHFPYRGDSHEQDRFVEHRPADTGSWLIHGHVHDTWRQSARMINVGVDVNDYRPVAADAIAEIVRTVS